MRKVIAGAIALALVASTAVATYAVMQPASTEKPDWTIADCSLWATEKDPYIPPYTRTDYCADNGRLFHLVP